jgi:hypothetical protein
MKIDKRKGGGNAMIYTNPEEYAKVCKCSLEIAKKRCEYYIKLHEKAEKVTCPSCNADYTNLLKICKMW